MKKIIRFFLSVVLLINCLIPYSVFAENKDGFAEPELSIDFSQNMISVSGISEKKDVYMIEVLFGETTHEQAGKDMERTSANVDATLPSGAVINVESNTLDAKSKIAYISHFSVDEKGKFDIDVTITQTGIYSVYLKNLTSGKAKMWSPVNFTCFADYKAIIGELNGKTSSKNDFVGMFSVENLKKLGFENPLNIDTSKAAEIYFDELSGKEISSAEYSDNTLLWNECCAILALNNGSCDNITEYIKRIVKSNAAIQKWYDSYIKTENDEKILTSNMKNRNIKDNKDLEKKLIEALVLKVVATPNGYLNIKNIMEEFKTTLSLSSVSSFSDVYNSLAGKTYKDISGLLSAYNDLVAKSSGNSAGGGGGTNIKSDNGSYTGMTIDMEKFDNTITQPLTNPIDMDIFSDIANVQWAKEAIVNLKIKGVISGKTDTIFAPNDNVTREEFTKMIISAVALDADKSEIGFADAKPGMWYYPYLQQAKGVGIINGISDTYFGVGNPITRQDMAVIIYNAARYKDVIGNSAPDDFPFGDDNDISSYAKNAVYTLKTMEIITGVDSVNFAPKAFATRAQAAVMIYRLLLK